MSFKQECEPLQIQKNGQFLPAKFKEAKTLIFQENVEIHILQGEREMVSGNKSLGKFKLEGIPQAPKGKPQIEVTFDINVDGMLSVTAKENESGKQQNITIQGASNLSEAEVNSMLEEAEKYAAIDKEQKENAEIIESAKVSTGKLEKLLNEEDYTAEQQKEINTIIDNLREAISLEKYDLLKEYMKQADSFITAETAENL